MRCPLPLYAVVVAAITLMLAGCLFLGPALAVHAAKRPLLGVFEISFGSMPAAALRLCCVLFLVLWLANLLTTAGVWWLSKILGGEVSPATTALVAAGTLLFLFLTGLQGPRTCAKLALFTNKLGVAILVSAMLRVHEGWPVALRGFPPDSEPPALAWVAVGLSRLAFYFAPLALLAAGSASRMPRQKQVAKIALAGVSLPFFATLVFLGLTSVATHASPIYQPSLKPTVVMALWAHVARSSLPGRILVAAITMFGAGRFGVRMLAETVAVRSMKDRSKLAILACLADAITWLSFHQEAPTLLMAFEASITALALAAAVLTADLLSGSLTALRVQRVNWVGVLAFVAGSAVPICMPRWTHSVVESWWHPWLLPSYGVAFLVCLSGRALQTIARVRMGFS